MTEYAKGQRLKVTMEVTVVGPPTAANSHIMEVRTPAGRFYYLPAYESEITVEPLAPKDWPPQAGDIWESDGNEWFVREHTMVPQQVVLEPASHTNQRAYGFGRDGERMSDFLALNPVLVRRRGA